jgi:hypothetical protein
MSVQALSDVLVGTELSVVVFGQLVHSILIFVIFSSGFEKVYNSNPRTEEKLKGNIHREIVNIPAKHRQRVYQNLFCQREEYLLVEENISFSVICEL